ncbi:MAG: twin transmembrane helix small protein [Neomegalonema sp.]|nr:twin transmembrane helix small protein [Neomegalonema sp.]
MTSLLLILIPIVLVAVVFVVGRGLFSFTQEGEEHRRRSNRMMQWRLVLQALAVVLILIATVVIGSGR